MSVTALPIRYHALAGQFQGHPKKHADVLRFAAGPGERRAQRLSRRRAALSQPRSRQGRRQPPRRRGDALGGAAPGARREPGAVGLRILNAFLLVADSVTGFGYSPAMKRSQLVWNQKTLDRFLADPTKVIPGTAMTYAGVPDALRDRALSGCPR